MDKEYLHKKSVNVPLYTGSLVILLCSELSVVEKKYGLPATKEYDAIVFNNRSKKGRDEYCVAFECKHLNNGTISHEALHMVTSIFKDHGIYIELSNDEPAAYFIGWIVDEIYKFIKQKGFKVK